ncbi:hypothetical protein GEMRC1_004880 [Eukaryota sp. GEM-RC1]
MPNQVGRPLVNFFNPNGEVNQNLEVLPETISGDIQLEDLQARTWHPSGFFVSPGTQVKKSSTSSPPASTISSNQTPNCLPNGKKTVAQLQFFSDAPETTPFPVLQSPRKKSSPKRKNSTTSMPEDGGVLVTPQKSRSSKPNSQPRARTNSATISPLTPGLNFGDHECHKPPEVDSLPKPRLTEAYLKLRKQSTC